MISMGMYYRYNLSKHSLREARPENLSRLARFLRLRIDDMSHNQIVKLVYWRITRVDTSRMY
jgi:hypothetical protein